MRILISILCIVGLVRGKDTTSSFSDSGIVRALTRVYEQCDDSKDIVKCLKIQATRLAGRALKVQNIKLIDGVSIVRKVDAADYGRASGDEVINNSDLETLSAKSLDKIFFGRLGMLLERHEIEVNIPRLLSFGQRQSAEIFGEGRGKKKGDKKYLGALMLAILMKAGILKMAYHSIAIIAGKALIVGKIALIISAIIGLKKLVSSEGHEKTTYEIVKHPHYQQSHTYSSSHGEYEGGHEGGSAYHRSIADEEMMMQDKAYRAHIPRSN